jgi:thioredoxin 1
MGSQDRDKELEAIRKRRLQKIMTQTPATSEPVKLTDETFDEFIQSTPIVLVDFWADWCGPCKMVAPILDELATKYKGKVWVGKLDVDRYGQTAMKYGATSIPTFWAFKDGEPVGRFVGAHPKPAFENIFQQLIDLDMEEVRRKKAEAQ